MIGNVRPKMSSEKLYGKSYLIREIERKLLLALCGARASGKKMINFALEDLKELQKLITKD